VLNILDIGSVKITFCKTKAINSVEKIGFSDSIVPADTYDPFMEGKNSRRIVFELVQRYGAQT
jgi:hypothetical protein